MHNLKALLEVPPLTKTLALRLAKSEADHMSSLMDNICKHLQLTQSRCDSIGNAKILLNPGGLLGPLFNRCLGFADEDLDSAAEIYGRFKELDCMPRFDLSPHSAGPRTMRALSDLGLYCARYHTFLYATPSTVNITYAGDIDVVQVDDSLTAVFADIWRRSFFGGSRYSAVRAERLDGKGGKCRQS